jgi:hypothetical protein
MLKKPRISKNFTLQDIKKIQHWMYEVTKDMTTEERNAFYSKGTEKIRKEIAEAQAERERKLAANS